MTIIACMWCGTEAEDTDLRSGDSAYCGLCDAITEHVETPHVVLYEDEEFDVSTLNESAIEEYFNS